MEALRIVYDQQGCQFCTTGLPVFAIFDCFPHIIGSKSFKNTIFVGKSTFLKMGNQIET